MVAMEIVAEFRQNPLFVRAQARPGWLHHHRHDDERNVLLFQRSRNRARHEPDTTGGSAER
jgi:hypothetical protein